MKTSHARCPTIVALLLTLAALGCATAVPGESGAQGRDSTSPEVQRVRQFADTLLKYGLDRYGPEHHPMWAAFIDTRDYSVPSQEVAAATQAGEGYYDRIHRRAVGGANLYHDVETIEAFEVLSAITGDPRYERAARDYLKSYLENAQSDASGLLGWGEHIYYDFYEDTVTVGGTHDMSHEFLARTPPWDRLWEIDPERTARAIDGLRYHFRSPVTQTYLFNRHARWDRDTARSPYDLMAQYQYDFGQPWIKHSALLAYSFGFLYAKTGDPEYLRMAEGVGNLYWRYRNPETNLTPGAIDDPRPTSARSTLGGASNLAYWLYRASELHPDLGYLRERALKMFEGAAKYAWRPEGRYYYTGHMNLDGTPFEPGDPAPAFLADFGRTAAFFAAKEKDPSYLEMARRMAAVMEMEPLPESFSGAQVAERMHLLLDLYDLTGDASLLERAARYAELGSERLWRGGLFARLSDDPFYESKDGPGAFAGALLRLHLARGGTVPAGFEPDWLQ